MGPLHQPNRSTHQLACVPEQYAGRVGRHAALPGPPARGPGRSGLLRAFVIDADGAREGLEAA